MQFRKKKIPPLIRCLSKPYTFVAFVHHKCYSPIASLRKGSDPGHDHVSSLRR